MITCGVGRRRISSAPLTGFLPGRIERRAIWNRPGDKLREVKVAGEAEFSLRCRRIPEEMTVRLVSEMAVAYRLRSVLGSDLDEKFTPVRVPTSW